MSLVVGLACFMLGGLFGMGLMSILIVGERGEHYDKK